MRSNTKWILALAIIKFLLPYLLQSNYYEPQRDEFLYLAEGRHLAWGYMEVPPMLSIFAWLTDFFGGSIFWIKFWPNLFGAFTFILIAKMIDHLGGKWFAILLALFPFVFSGWLRMFFLFQPNAPEIFFDTLMVYGVFRFVQTSKDKWLYVIGIAIGLGLLSKYTVAFWTVSLLLGLCLFNARSVLANKHFYFSLLLAAFIFLPNFLWQYQHNFPVFFHMNELKETQLQYVSVLGFFSGQFLMYLPVFFVWIAGLIALIFVFQFRKFRSFAVAFIIYQLLMILFQGKDYYTAGTFTVLFAFGAYWLEQLTGGKKKWLRPAMIVFSCGLGIILWPILLPVAKPASLSNYYEMISLKKTGGLRWEDHKDHPLPQDFADMLAWKEMTEKTEKAYGRLSENEKKSSVIWCDNYGQAGAFNFYKGHAFPESYSSNASFLFWLPDISEVENFVVITKDIHEEITGQFQTTIVADSITNKYAVEYGTKILILKKPSSAFRSYFMNELSMLKKRFGVK